ncbi:hypothetical protein DSO57_1014238 [Entomophthora muscae]|uniref:Uncharacterized protein n=2 Tax=Entomophthora muscae TaxID=34485 RepID=A0ACC2TFZ9_9FUNG|nr:hypothetical protein DSO57_1014236 [Entomophthora muscae]KAJ9073629.1 hypothetical protein DSO57_1014238 [Entomophthora muscae]
MRMSTNRKHATKEVISNTAPFVTDYERQQAERYPGMMVHGRYYLRPRVKSEAESKASGINLYMEPYICPPAPTLPKFSFAPEVNSYPSVKREALSDNINPELPAIEENGNFFSALLQHLIAFLMMLYFGIMFALRVVAYYSYVAFSQTVHFLSVFVFSSKTRFISCLLLGLASFCTLYFPVPKSMPFSNFPPEFETAIPSVNPIVLTIGLGLKNFWLPSPKVIAANLYDLLPQNVSPTFSRKYFLNACRIFMELPSDLSYKWRPNLASSKVGTRIVYPDTPTFKVKYSSPGPKPVYSMEASQALEDSMEPGHCWPFSAQGGKLSFRLPFKVQPTKFIIHHPESSNEPPPSSIDLLAHIPLAGHKRGVWKIVASGALHWQVSPKTFSLFAEFDTSDVNLEASHFRLMAYLDQDAGSEAQFGCVYSIDLKGKFPHEITINNLIL